MIGKIATLATDTHTHKSTLQVRVPPCAAAPARNTVHDHFLLLLLLPLAAQLLWYCSGTRCVDR